MSDEDPLTRALGRLPRPLRTVARDVLAAESRLDAVACAPDGATVAVLRAPAEGDRSALVDLLAHVRWLAPRLADWKALAPDLPLAADTPVRGLLVAPGFDPRTRAAAAALGPERLALGLWHAPPPGVPGMPWIEPVHGPGPLADARVGADAAPDGALPARDAMPPPRPEGLRSRFRTGLREDDLATRPPPGPSSGA